MANADVFVAMVRPAIAAGWDEARRQAFITPLMNDAVFVKTENVLTVNAEVGTDGRAPLQRAAKAYESAYGIPWVEDMATGIAQAIAHFAEVMRRWSAMNIGLVKALIALVPTCLLLFGSLILLVKGRTVFSILQALGAVCLVVVALAHVAEALRWFPSMRWGEGQSLGHYLDLSSAVLGVTLFSLGYLIQAFRAPGGGHARQPSATYRRIRF